MEDTKTLVLKFRKKTLDILNCFGDESYEKLDGLFGEREDIIKIFKDNPGFYTKDKIKDELKNTDIMELDAKIKELTIENIKEIKEKLVSINKDKFIRGKYETGFSGNSLFFNKKVY